MITPPLANIILVHHERYDGKGYPKGLVGDQIPLQARIIAIADAYDAMTYGRPYKLPLTADGSASGNSGRPAYPV